MKTHYQKLTESSGWAILYDVDINFVLWDRSSIHRKNLMKYSHIESETWYHLTIVIDPLATFVTMYQDGSFLLGGQVELHSNVTYTVFDAGLPKLVFGASSYTLSGNYGKVTLDNLYIWEKLLSATEASELYVNQMQVL